MARVPAKQRANRAPTKAQKAPTKATAAAKPAPPAPNTKPPPTPQRLPHWLNKAQMAASLGISTQAFEKWGVPQAAAIGREVFFTVDDVLANRLALIDKRHRDALAALQAEAVGDDEVNAELEKALLTRAQRVGQEIKNAERQRELAPVALIEWTLAKVGGQIAAILESVPLKVKRVLPKLTATEVEHIKREVVKAQNVAAGIVVDLDEYYERNPNGDHEVGEAGAENT